MLTSLFAAFLAVTVVMVLLHHPTNAPAGSASAAAVSSDAARLHSATQSINADTSKARSRLHSLSGGFPTPSNVKGVINPYISSLQHYQAVLSGTKVPTSARGAAANVRKLVSRELTSLSTIHTLPSLRLGSYLEQFGTGSARLQKDLSTFERALRDGAS